jgi:hypothetical protein
MLRIADRVAGIPSSSAPGLVVPLTPADTGKIIGTSMYVTSTSGAVAGGVAGLSIGLAEEGLGVISFLGVADAVWGGFAVGAAVGGAVGVVAVPVVIGGYYLFGPRREATPVDQKPVLTCR